MILKGIKLVTFDATNTILKFKVPPWHQYASVAREHGYSGTRDDLKMRLLDSYKVVWKKHPNFGKDSIKWEEWWHRVVRGTLKDQLSSSANIKVIANELITKFETTTCWCKAEGGEQLLIVLKKCGMHLGIISNFDPRLHNILQNISFHKYFDFILTSYDYGYCKPDERIFKHAVNKYNSPLQPNECLHIGDDLKKDYEGARAAGWHAILISPKEELKRTETPPAPEHVFTSLQELTLAIEQNRLKLL